MRVWMAILLLSLPLFCLSQSSADFEQILQTVFKQKQDTGIYHYSKQILSLYGTTTFLSDTLTGFNEKGQKQSVILSNNEYGVLKTKFYSQLKKERPENLIDSSFLSELGGASTGEHLVFAISEPVFIRNNSLCIFILFPAKRGCGCISINVFRNKVGSWEEYFRKTLGCF